jgi:hypothetical protein
LTALINYNFVLEGSPSPTDEVINGLVVTGMTAPYTGGMTVKMTAKYTLHASSPNPLVQGFSDNHYRCAAARRRVRCCILPLPGYSLLQGRSSWRSIVRAFF